MKDDELQIKSVIDEWMRATKAGDSEAMLKLMTDDVVFMVPGAEPFGKEEFLKASESQSDIKIEGTSEVIEMEIFEDKAFVRAFINMDMKTGAAEPTKKSGYTLSLFKKCSDGAWRLYRDANLLT